MNPAPAWYILYLARTLALYPTHQPAGVRLASAWITTLGLLVPPACLALPLGWPLSGGLPLLLVAVLNMPRLWGELRRPLPTDPLGVRLLRTVLLLALAGGPVTLLVLLERGYRPALWAAITAEARRQRFRRERPHWRNWGHTAACDPQVAFFPETLADLVAIVAEARATGRRIRVAATGHSWPALAATPDILVVSHGLNQITVDRADPAHPLLVAEAGATNEAMNAVLEAQGLTLPFNVVLESVRIGGLVATGSHGSGWDTPTLSDLVERIEIVGASGDLVCYSAATHGADLMNAVRLSLGLFGIIYRVHLRVQPNYRVQHIDSRVPVDTMLREIAGLVPRHENLDLYYWPYQQQVTIRVWDRTEAPRTAATRKTLARRWGHTAVVPIHAAFQWIMRRWPATVPAICAFDYVWLPHYRRVTDVVEAIHWRSAIELLRVSCVEFAFKLDPDFATFHQAWQAVIRTADIFAAQGRYPFNMTLNARFIGESACLLAPAGGPGHTCYIEILSSTPTPGWEEFASAVAAEWMRLPGARPHWGKEWEFIPGIVPFIGRAYGDHLRTFLRLRADHAGDPDRMFSNDLLDRILFENPALREPVRAAAEPLPLLTPVEEEVA